MTVELSHCAQQVLELWCLQPCVTVQCDLLINAAWPVYAAQSAVDKLITISIVKQQQ
jgi:hypothetical protein